jgi:hypothetical protein
MSSHYELLARLAQAMRASREFIGLRSATCSKRHPPLKQHPMAQKVFNDVASTSFAPFLLNVLFISFHLPSCFPNFLTNNVLVPVNGPLHTLPHPNSEMSTKARSPVLYLFTCTALSKKSLFRNHVYTPPTDENRRTQ